MKRRILFAPLVIGLASLLLFVGVVFAATLYENYNTGGNSFFGFSATTWRAQTFTTTSAHDLVSVKLYIGRGASLPGNVTISIKATSAGVPNGADLASVVVDGDLWIGPAWREFTMDSPINLINDTLYAIVVHATSGPANASWQLDAQDATYTVGTACFSFDSGGTWEIEDFDSKTYDYMFEVWGSDPTPTPVPPTPTNTPTYCDELTGTNCLAKLTNTSDTSGHIIFMAVGALFIVGIGLGAGLHPVALAAILLLYVGAFVLTAWLAGVVLVTIVLFAGIFTLFRIFTGGSG